MLPRRTTVTALAVLTVLAALSPVAPAWADHTTDHTIAQMIGSSRETVSRTMRNLVERGIIQVTRKDITLKDRRSLMLAARRA